MNRKLVFLFGMLTVIAMSCSGDEVGDSGSPALPPLDIPLAGALGPDSKLDVVVVSIDTLRADRLPFYGAEHATAGDPQQPWSLAWMAAQGTTFDRTWAPAGMTLPSFGTLWTGLSPLEHGAKGNHRRVTAETYPMQLARQGWVNHAVVANRVLSKGCGVDRGFASYYIRAKEQEGTGPALLLKSTGEVVEQHQRTLIWAHYMAPHQPYEPNSQHLGKFSTAGGVAGDKATLEAIHADPGSVDDATIDHLRGLYDEEILTANDYVVTFLSGLDQQYRQAGRGGLLDNAVVVVVSDHGEELADHEGYFMHAKSIYSGSTHVPLVVLGGGWKAGHRVGRAVALAEVMPMVLHGEQPRSEVFFSAWHELFFAARDERWTLIHNPSNNQQGPTEPPKGVFFVYPQVALFDRLADPLEQVDVAAEHPEETRRLLDALHDWYFGLDQTAGAAEVNLTPEEIANLEELGYTDGQGAVLNPDLPWTGAQWNP